MMSRASSHGHRTQNAREEVINVATSLAGLLGAFIGTPILIVDAFEQGGVFLVFTHYAYALSLIALYLASGIYHALPGSRVKEVARIADHCAIFLLIAGTYTPFALGPLRGDGGWVLFTLQWGLALLGMAMKIYGWFNIRWFSVALYLFMGWMAVFFVVPLWTNVALPGLLLLAAGGISYTIGVGFYAMHGRVHMHNIWHLFILAGSAFHFFAVLWYA